METAFAASERALLSALTAQEKAVSAAFQASDKAITKAEDAQRDYNARTNEFRAQLSDQATRFPTRIEIDSRLLAIEDKISVLAGSADSKIATIYKTSEEARVAIVTASNRRFDGLVDDIKSLRESRAQGAGRTEAFTVGLSQAVSYVVITSGIVGIVTFLLAHH